MTGSPRSRSDGRSPSRRALVVAAALAVVTLAAATSAYGSPRTAAPGVTCDSGALLSRYPGNPISIMPGSSECR